MNMSSKEVIVPLAYALDYAALLSAGRADSTANVSTSRGARMKGWFWSTEEFVSANRDRGHFIAHSIGGGLDVNVFWQDRDLNRGWSPEGKIFRQMETYCQEHPGTFCFSRPI